MQDKMITMPELALIAGTRAAFGAGVGLLLAGRLNTEQRRAVGWTLVAVGALTTIPLAAEVFFRGQGPDGRSRTRSADGRSRAEHAVAAK